MHIIEIHIFVLVVRIAGEQILWRLFNYPITAAPSAVREINLNAKIFADGTLNISILKSMRKWAWHVEDGGGGCFGLLVGGAEAKTQTRNISAITFG